jgi:hypothetical protein
MMKRTIPIFLSLAFFASGAGPDEPHYTAEGQLQRPADYREWIFLASGFGMSYSASQPAQNAAPPFDNVFVTRPAYQQFMQTGKWPDKTMFVLEVRSSQSKGSINQNGHFQGDDARIEIEVKDEKRFPGKWAFFGFQTGEPSGKLLPKTATCYACHATNGAVDNTFVQFYPILRDVAKQKGTLKGGE